MQTEVPPELRGYFTTGVAGITTLGRDGPNIMSAEWTYHVSYNPFLISVLIDPREVSHQLIEETKEFGVNLWAEDQAHVSSAAGNHSMKDVRKLPNPIFKTYQATYIKAPMIEGCILNAECRLVTSYSIGDHTMFVGAVLVARYDPNKKPLVLRGASGYHELGPGIRTAEKPFSYVFAGLQKGEDGVFVNLGGRVFGAKKGEDILVSVENAEGKRIVSQNVMITERSFFYARLKLDNGVPLGTYTLTAIHDELTANCVVQLT